MIINWFSKTHKGKQIEEAIIPIKYISICGIVEHIEIKKTQNTIDGVLLDIEGREFLYTVKTNGDLLRLHGIKEDLSLSYSVCVDYLKNIYGKNDLLDLKRELRNNMQQLQFAIGKLAQEVSEIEIPEIIQPVQPVQGIEIKNNELEIEDTPLIDEEFEGQISFDDFSDEDLASHALKVLNGEIKLTG